MIIPLDKIVVIIKEMTRNNRIEKSSFVSDSNVQTNPPAPLAIKNQKKIVIQIIRSSFHLSAGGSINK